jgi:hypothetical protein
VTFIKNIVMIGKRLRKTLKRKTSTTRGRRPLWVLPSKRSSSICYYHQELHQEQVGDHLVGCAEDELALLARCTAFELSLHSSEHEDRCRKGLLYW